MKRMHRLIAAVAIGGLVAVAAPRAASAQLTIQQPVFGVTSTVTTVSVPDRGRAHLSSINSAGESRSSFGPFRSGTNTGVFREGSTTSVSATIHDFDAMDRYLLGQPPSGVAGARSGPRVDDPYQQLLARSQRRGTSTADDSGLALRRGMGAEPPRSLPPIECGFFPTTTAAYAGSGPVGRTAADRAAHFFGLGRQAEERGADSVARLHYRLAAKHGHAEAAARLAALEPAATKPIANLAGRN